MEKDPKMNIFGHILLRRPFEKIFIVWHDYMFFPNNPETVETRVYRALNWNWASTDFSQILNLYIYYKIWKGISTNVAMLR